MEAIIEFLNIFVQFALGYAGAMLGVFVLGAGCLYYLTRSVERPCCDRTDPHWDCEGSNVQDPAALEAAERAVQTMPRHPHDYHELEDICLAGELEPGGEVHPLRPPEDLYENRSCYCGAVPCPPCAWCEGQAEECTAGSLNPNALDNMVRAEDSRCVQDEVEHLEAQLRYLDWLAKQRANAGTFKVGDYATARVRIQRQLDQARVRAEREA